MPSPAPAQPVLRAPQAATQLGASLDPSAKYGGIAWGQIDRGRYSTGPQAPAPQAGEALTPGAPLQLGPPPSAASPLALSPVPSPAPAQPVLDPGKPAVSSPAPAMATPGLTPMSAEVAARIPAAEPVRAPSANAMAAAMRKQALRDAESGLGDQRTSGRPQPNVPRRWENPAAAPSPAAAVVPAANGGGATAAALGGAGAGAEGEVSTPRALVSARYGRAEPGQVSPPRGITPSGEVRPVNLVDSAENATPPDVRALRKNKKLEDSRSFFETIPEALAFPLLGHGASWIISITLWTIALSLLRLIPGFNMVGVFVLLTTTLAFCADYHRRCVWSITTGAKSIDQPPDFDPQRIAQQYVASGSHLTFFMLLSQFPLAFWMVKQLTDDAVDLSVFQVVTAPMFWALAVGPAFYWPMAVATASMHSDYAAVWYVPMGLRAIVRAPLEHLTVVVLGALALIVVWAPFLWIGQASGLPSAFFFATLGLPFAISHGVMGALTGHMVRARDDAFA
jgi:hypothetical protein